MPDYLGAKKGSKKCQIFNQPKKKAAAARKAMTCLWNSIKGPHFNDWHYASWTKLQTCRRFIPIIFFGFNISAMVGKEWLN